MSWLEKTKKVDLLPGDVAVYWIGQAGFAFQLANGKWILLDPYLTDSVYEDTKDELGFDFKRVASALFSPEDLQPDYLLMTHEHGDHLDTAAVKTLCDPEKTVCVGNFIVKKILEDLGVSAKENVTVTVGDKVCFEDFTLYAVTADHGELAPGALGFVLDFGVAKVYYSGDTCLNESVIAEAKRYAPNLALLPINGAFGNLDGVKAAEFAQKLECRYCIPHHFWTFPAHYGDPIQAVKAFAQLGADYKLLLLTPGDPIYLSELMKGSY